MSDPVRITNPGAESLYKYHWHNESTPYVHA